MDLAQAIARLRERLPDLRVDTGPLDPGWITLAALAEGNGERLETMLAEEALSAPSLDRRGRAAYLVGNFAYRLGEIGAGFHLDTHVLPEIAPQAIAIRSERYGWAYAGQSGEATRLHLRFLSSTLTAEPDIARRRVQLRLMLEASLRPVVDRLVVATRLSTAAQFRQGADGIAAAFLAIGRSLGRETQAMDQCLAMLRVQGSPFNNSQTGYVDIRIPDPADPEKILASEVFRTRGGCCRYYTCDDGDYCATCVLRKPADRDRRLTAYLRGQAGLG